MVDEAEFMTVFQEAVQYVLRSRGACVAEVCEPGESVFNPRAVAKMNRDMVTLEQEQFRVVLLNVKNEVLQVVTLYQGALDRCSIRVAEVFKAAIRVNANAIIHVHNHPSGQPEPSVEDKTVHHLIKQAGELLNITVLDGLIVARRGYCSVMDGLVYPWLGSDREAVEV